MRFSMHHMDNTHFWYLEVSSRASTRSLTCLLQPRPRTQPTNRVLRQLDVEGDALEIHYRHILETLAKERGMLGVIFRKAQNKIQDPAKLRRLIADLIDKEEWTSLDADVKGDAYEGLLEKNAADVKGGAGQYFTRRTLIQAVVDVMRPGPGQTIHDSACGTGGFLLIAHDYVSQHNELDRDQKKSPRISWHGRPRALPDALPLKRQVTIFRPESGDLVRM
jgi:type I restriction-modification system DNA methylase subunit